MRPALLALVCLGISSCVAPVANSGHELGRGPVVVIVESRDGRLEVTADSFDGPAGPALRRMTAIMADAVVDRVE